MSGTDDMFGHAPPPKKRRAAREPRKREFAPALQYDEDGLLMRPSDTFTAWQRGITVGELRLARAILMVKVQEIWTYGWSGREELQRRYLEEVEGLGELPDNHGADAQRTDDDDGSGRPE